MDKRKEKRYSLRLNVTCEKVLPDGSFDFPLTVTVKDLSMDGLCFYTHEKIDLKSRMRIKIYISDEESVSVEGQVVRVLPSGKEDLKYIVLIQIDHSDSQTSKEIQNFLDRIDIDKVLEKLDLDNVMDVHLAVGYPPIIKKATKLLTYDSPPFTEYELQNLLLGMLDEYRYSKFMKEKELNFIWATQSGTRFRVNLHFQQTKIEGVFRKIPAKIGAPSDLGLPPAAEELLSNTRGLILIAGRTGSGKTTTLASMVEYINNRRNSIIVCIEEPIEYLHENKGCIIKQREVGRDTLSFYNAAKNALRQNPDVLVVGEILDMETMETAITAAETGTLVLTSIHAGTSAQTFDRVTSFFPADTQKLILGRLSLILKGVIIQNLIPRVDGEGLVLATEITIVNSAVRRVIRDAEWNQIPSLIQINRNIGMQTMKNSLEKLHNMGLIQEEYVTGDLTS